MSKPQNLKANKICMYTYKSSFCFADRTIIDCICLKT